LKILAVPLVVGACLLSACNGSDPAVTPGTTATSPSPTSPPETAREHPTAFHPPCRGGGSHSTFESWGPPGAKTGTSEAWARRIMADYLRMKGSKRSLDDAQIIGRADLGNGAKRLAFLFDEGGGNWYLYTFFGADGRWSMSSEDRCYVRKGYSYLKGTWNVKALAGADDKLVPLPDSQFGTVKVTLQSGRITAFDGCDDMSGGYRFMPKSRRLRIPTLGTSNRATCDDPRSPLASHLRAVRHIQGERDTRRLYDGDGVLVIELVR